jgi:hypothetical protein
MEGINNCLLRSGKRKRVMVYVYMVTTEKEIWRKKKVLTEVVRKKESNEWYN